MHLSPTRHEASDAPLVFSVKVWSGKTSGRSSSDHQANHIHGNRGSIRHNATIIDWKTQTFDQGTFKVIIDDMKLSSKAVHLTIFLKETATQLCHGSRAKIAYHLSIDEQIHTIV